MPDLELVRQLDPLGCGVACVAMVAGVDYASALAVFDDSERAQRGTEWAGQMKALRKLGVLSAVTFPWGDLENGEWIPFAASDRHIVMLVPPAPVRAHCVVLYGGKVYDPHRGILGVLPEGEAWHAISCWRVNRDT
jgi:hypothetical protein